MMLIVSGLVFILTILTMHFSLKMYLIVSKYKEAALGLIFTHLKESVLYFKIYAVSISILAISRFLDVINIYNLFSIADIATAMVLLSDFLLVIVFYKLSKIMDLEEEAET
ncbi:hypothetical protein [Methanobacterium alcaliphilum]|uniref:hypothetical protein n=1 Tax=Methanobacterium alcaliphilum TaxID=392018 RepID=UPI00200B5D18|nr:hypothetical protein [Methanobacterium alcaliphilum]MCK9151852.1 hypothetical protein [Methanobacterium alcaliphilum]